MIVAAVGGWTYGQQSSMEGHGALQLRRLRKVTWLFFRKTNACCSSSREEKTKQL